jgi:hypothetical protein
MTYLHKLPVSCLQQKLEHLRTLLSLRELVVVAFFNNAALVYDKVSNRY